MNFISLGKIPSLVARAVYKHDLWVNAKEEWCIKLILSSVKLRVLVNSQSVTTFSLRSVSVRSARALTDCYAVTKAAVTCLYGQCLA